MALGLIGMIAAFVIALTFTGGGGVRHVPITFNEIIPPTVAFRDIDGEPKIVGITGCRGSQKESYIFILCCSRRTQTV